MRIFLVICVLSEKLCKVLLLATFDFWGINSKKLTEINQKLIANQGSGKLALKVN